MGWLQFLEQDKEKHTKLDYYLAQVAKEVAATRARYPATLKTANYLLTFKTPLSDEDRLKRSKAFWGAAVNMELN